MGAEEDMRAEDGCKRGLQRIGRGGEAVRVLRGERAARDWCMCDGGERFGNDQRALAVGGDGTGALAGILGRCCDKTEEGGNRMSCLAITSTNARRSLSPSRSAKRFNRTLLTPLSRDVLHPRRCPHPHTPPPCPKLGPSTAHRLQASL